MQIPLINSTLTAQVDAADYSLVSPYVWSFIQKRNKAYAYARLPSKRRVYLHRVIMAAPRGKLVDHQDNDGLNNHRANLRLCTRSENMGNSRAHRDRKGQFKGVYFERSSGRYVAQICQHKTRRKIGRYATAIAAARAYDTLAILTFGTFAKINFHEPTSPTIAP